MVRRLLAEGKLEAWLSGKDDRLRARAVDIMVERGQRRVDEVTELLISIGRRKTLPRTLAMGGPLCADRAERALFELLLAAVAEGEIDGREGELWLDIHGLAEADLAGQSSSCMPTWSSAAPPCVWHRREDRRSGLE